MEHWVTHPFPEGGLAPWDVDDDRPQWLVVASGRLVDSTLTSFDPGTALSTAMQHVDMGYTSLLTAQKTAVARDGQVVRTWPEVWPPPDSLPADEHPREGRRRWGYGVLPRPRVGRTQPDVVAHADDDGGRAAALAEACSRSLALQVPAVVVLVVHSRGWH